MKEITIIGKNSILYKQLKNSLQQNFKITRELSHQELDKVERITNPLIFSFDKKSLKSNIKMLKTISDKSIGQSIYVSTSAIHAHSICRYYKYPKIKKNIENYLIEKTNVSILRFGVLKSKSNLEGFVGHTMITSTNMFAESINMFHCGANRINECYKRTYIKPTSSLQKIILLLLKKLLFLKGFYVLLRPLDLFLKLINFKNYGYSFLSNHHTSHKIENVIVGRGMAGLGVYYALMEHVSNQKVKIIGNTTSKDLFSIEINNKKRVLEKAFSGGNSQLWHSVISIFNSSIDKSFREKELNRFFKLTKSNLLWKGYSFIPFRPLRPLSYFPKKFINDKIILIEENKNDIILYGKNKQFRAEKVFLCTGAISTLKILNNSNLLSDKKITFSDHSIGLIGQLKTKEKIKHVIFDRKGHYKKHLKVKLNGDTNAYLSVRPAFFELKDIKKAEYFKGFYADSSINIILKLIKRFFFPGIILEALYNKFGVNFFKTNVYNILGHIDNPDSFEFDKKTNEINFTKNSIELVDSNMQDVVNEILGGELSIKQGKINLLPGLHFLECSLDLRKIENLFKNKLLIHSTLKFKNLNPEHPTFDLYLDSKDCVNKLINR